MKAIIWIRTSTKEQSIEDQQRDLEQLAHSKGYNDLLVIGKQGASAIKMDEQYKREVNTLIETLSSTDIKCVFVWEVSRLARNELAFYTMKDFIVKNGIQLYCKTPDLKLLNDDGSINQGAEIALNLLVTLAKQEMQIKAARFKRKKDAMRKLGKLTSGKPVYGYTKQGKGFGMQITINETEADVVRYIFNRYANESISINSLGKVMMARWENPTTLNSSYQRVRRIIADPCYYGGKPSHSDIVYPPIVSKELWDKCNEKASQIKHWEKTATKNVYYCKSIIKNKESDKVMLAVRSKATYQDNRKYPMNYSVSINAIDSLVWMLAKHYKSMMVDVDWNNHIDEYKANISQYKAEIGTLKQLIGSIIDKRKKAQKRLLNGIIDDDVYNDINKGWNKEQKEYESRIAFLKSQIEQLEYLLDNKDDSDNSMKATKESLDTVTDDSARRKIILDVIKTVYVEKVDSKKRLYQITYDLNVPLPKLPFVYQYTGIAGKMKLYRVYTDGRKDDISSTIERRFNKE